MNHGELDEPEQIKALFDELQKQPLQQFGTEWPPKEHGVYIIYGACELDVRYVGKTNRVSMYPAPFRRGLLRRLDNHRKKYGRQTGFRCLIVRDPRQRTLLEAYATGVLCPADVKTGGTDALP